MMFTLKQMIDKLVKLLTPHSERLDRYLVSGLKGDERQVELHQNLTHLPPAAIYWIGLVMHIGRGSVAPGNLMDRYKQFRQGNPRSEWVAEDICTRGYWAAQYLRRGLSELTMAGIDIDRIYYMATVG